MLLTVIHILMPLRKDFLRVRQTAPLSLLPAYQRLSSCFLADSVCQRREDDENTHHPEFCNRMVINEARQERAEQDAYCHDNTENHCTEVLDGEEDE